MGNIGVKELLIILVIVLILFGAKKVPELARGLGTGIKEFKKAAKEAGDDDNAKAASSNEPSSTDKNQPASDNERS